MIEAVIFNNGQPKDDIEYFENMINQTKDVLHEQLIVMEQLKKEDTEC